MRNHKTFISLLLLTSLIWHAVPISAQLFGPIAGVPEFADASRAYSDLLQRTRGSEYPALLEKLFGEDAEAAAQAFDDGSAALVQAVAVAAGDRADEILEKQIAERKEKPSSQPIVAPAVLPVKEAAPRTRRMGFDARPQIDWRQLAFGFQPFNRRQDEKPDVKMTETDKEIKAEGSNKKSFETKDAKGTRTQKAETRYTKDGKTFGVEIKDTQIIEAVSKPDGRSFRKETSLVWGADVAACPDTSGVTLGTGKAKVLAKTIYVENGVTITMTSEFDLQAKMTGYVNDQAEMTHYDMQIDAYATNSGYEDALDRGLIKEIKIKDGRYGLHYDIPGNTIEISDGKYGGNRTPAKMGKATARKLTPMTGPDAETIGKAIGPMVPSIWNSANEMYKSAQKHWRNYGCVEVICKVPKTVLEQGDEVNISTETIHLQDNSKINGQLTAEAYQGTVTPETQSGNTTAAFTFTQSGEGNPSFHVESVSKRGIGRGDVEFTLKKEKEESTEAGVWTGTISAERKQREEREKRSGANLAENGGYLETSTNVQLQLTGMLDRTVDANNAHIANVSGLQEAVDFEYDRYKIDEGYCGPNAVPYKGPKEITRTSTTTVNFNKQTRVYVEIGSSNGSISFSLPEQAGTAVHKYVHKSPCAEHDRANTNEAIDEEVATAGGSFSFSFPIDPSQRSVKGSITVVGEDGSMTTYRWELSRRE